MISEKFSFGTYLDLKGVEDTLFFLELLRRVFYRLSSSSTIKLSNFLLMDFNKS